MLTDGSEFCIHHVRRVRKAADEALTAELFASTDDFSTAASVNRFIGNVIKQFALKRIHQRDAATFGYLGQLLLNGIVARQREEVRAAEAAKSASAKEDVTIIWDMPAPPYERNAETQGSR